MYNFNNKGMTKDLIWFAKRFNALLVKFPEEITPEILEKDDICSRYDPEEAFEALKSAHKFLFSIANEMLSMPEHDDGRMAVLEKAFSKLDLLWGLVFYGGICESGNEYCISFTKSGLKNDAKTLPSSYLKSFENITENGCRTEYLKGGGEAKDYKSCDGGVLYFDDNLTALGIYLFIKKVMQKRWYWDEDKAGNYTESLAYAPVKHCAEPYHRADMRVFICGERLKYDFYEHLAGYGDEIIGYFNMIYDFVKENYPECLPSGQGFWDYINCTVSFSASPKHQAMGGIGLGGSEYFMGFYCSKDKNVRKAALEEFGLENVRGEFFDIKNQADVEYAVKIFEIKAKHGKNIIPKLKKGEEI